MRLADHVSVSRRYARSASLERDAQANDALTGYQLTGRVVEMLDRLTAAAEGGMGGAWSITGPYGSGKSSLGLLIDALFGPADSEAFGLAMSLVDEVSPELGARIVRARAGGSAQGFARGLVTAGAEPVTHTVARALDRAVLQWFGKRPSKREFPESSLLEAALDDASSDDPRRTGPAPGSLVEVAVALSRHAPLLLLIDEFGKNLEAAQSRSDADLYLLQLLAEAAQSSRGAPLYLITMQHLAFNEYAAAADTVQQREWAKVQGRFEDVAFIDSSEQTRELISHVFEHTTELQGAVATWSADQAKAMASLSLFDVADASLLAECFPLSPLTLAVLPELCRRYGQNERTLFTFLTSGDQRAVPECLADLEVTSDRVATIDLPAVYDFFVSGASGSLPSSSARWSEIALRLRDIAGIAPPAMNLAKCIAILNLVGTNGPLRASKGLLLSLDPEAGPHLDELESAGVVVYRDSADEYRIWQGTGLDLNGIIEQARAGVATRSAAQVLSEAAPLAPAVAAGHSMRTDTLRTFERLYLARGSEVEAPQAGSAFDGRVYVAIEAGVFAPDVAPSGLPVVLHFPREIDQLRSAASEVLALRKALAEPVVQEDWVARAEVRERLGSATSLLNGLLDGADGTGQWCLLTEDGPVELASGPGSAALSEAADLSYPQAVPIRNETLNRVELSSQGAKARRQLLLAMLDHEGAEGLGLEGHGPEVAMYVALLREPGIHRLDTRSGAWALRPPTDDRFRSVWNAVEGELRRATDRRVSITDIHAALQMPPIGMKAGPIPVLVTAVLLASADEVALYEHGTFRPILTEEVCDRMVRNPGHFEVKHFANSSGARRAIVDRLASRLDLQPGFRKQRVGNVLSVVSAIVSHVAALPLCTLRAEDLSSEAIAVRDAIVAAVEPDQLLFDHLPRAVGLQPVGPSSSATQNADAFADRLATALDELARYYDQLLEGLAQELFALARERGRRALSAQAQVLEGEVVDPDVRAFVLALATDSFDDDHWIENIATVVTRTAVRQWKPADRARFGPELNGRLASLRRLLVLHSEMRGLGAQGFDAHRVTLTSASGREDGVLVALDESDRAIIAREVDPLLESLAATFESRERAEKALLAWSAERVFPHVVTPAVDSVDGTNRKAVNDV